jgi:hypothetical protein
LAAIALARTPGAAKTPPPMPPPTKLDLTIRRHPTSRFDAEDTQVDRITLSGHDAVLADHAILLAASNYLAREK